MFYYPVHVKLSLPAALNGIIRCVILYSVLHVLDLSGDLVSGMHEHFNVFDQ